MGRAGCSLNSQETNRRESYVATVALCTIAIGEFTNASLVWADAKRTEFPWMLDPSAEQTESPKMTIVTKRQICGTTIVGIEDKLQRLCGALYCIDLRCDAKWKPCVVTISRNKALNWLYQWCLKCNVVAMYCSSRIAWMNESEVRGPVEANGCNHFLFNWSFWWVMP